MQKKKREREKVTSMDEGLGSFWYYSMRYSFNLQGVDVPFGWWPSLNVRAFTLPILTLFLSSTSCSLPLDFQKPAVPTDRTGRVPFLYFRSLDENTYHTPSWLSPYFSVKRYRADEISQVFVICISFN